MQSRLPGWLRSWGLSQVQVLGEVTDLGDRSRAWRVRAGGADYVVKVFFDAVDYVEPGLRIAASLDRAGIVTGAPVLTRTGALCRRVWGWRGPATVAVLEFVAGQPLDWASPGAPEACGDLLGRVHHALATTAEPLAPAGRLVEFYAQQANRMGGQRGRQLAEAVAAVDDVVKRVGLTWGVLYGDPAPEVLCEADSGRLALIDWGTPSWGPLLHDVVSWQRCAERHRPGDHSVGLRLLQAYRAQHTVSEAELASREIFVRLHQAIQDSWQPTENR